MEFTFEIDGKKIMEIKMVFRNFRVIVDRLRESWVRDGKKKRNLGFHIGEGQSSLEF